MPTLPGVQAHCCTAVVIVIFLYVVSLPSLHSLSLSLPSPSLPSHTVVFGCGVPPGRLWLTSYMVTNVTVYTFLQKLKNMILDTIRTRRSTLKVTSGIMGKQGRTASGTTSNQELSRQVCLCSASFVPLAFALSSLYRCSMLIIAFPPK